MSKQKTISVAKDFTRYPFGRYPEHGDKCGQLFRENHLVPALNENDQVIVILDGTEGYGSSFLDEAFAGLVRASGFTKEVVKRKIDFTSKDDPSLIDEILGYIDEV